MKPNFNLCESRFCRSALSSRMPGAGFMSMRRMFATVLNCLPFSGRALNSPVLRCPQTGAELPETEDRRAENLRDYRHITCGSCNPLMMRSSVVGTPPGTDRQYTNHQTVARGCLGRGVKSVYVGPIGKGWVPDVAFSVLPQKTVLCCVVWLWLWLCT